MEFRSDYTKGQMRNTEDMRNSGAAGGTSHDHLGRCTGNCSTHVLGTESVQKHFVVQDADISVTCNSTNRPYQDHLYQKKYLHEWQLNLQDMSTGARNPMSTCFMHCACTMACRLVFAARDDRVKPARATSYSDNMMQTISKWTQVSKCNSQNHLHLHHLQICRC